jgi:transposase
MVLSEKKKYEIIVKYEMGLTIREISKDMKIGKNTVSRWLKQYRNYNNVNRKQGSGRKKIINENNTDYLLNEIKKDNTLTTKILAEKIKKEKQINVTAETVRRCIKSNGIIYAMPSIKPFMSDEHKRKRLEWALNNMKTDWSKVIFSDETKIEKHTRIKKRWIDKNNITIIQTVKYPLKVNIWGCITIGGTETIYIFKEIMDAKVYTDILDRNLLTIYDCDSFKNEIEKQWKLIKFETIYNLIESMPIRIIKVIENNGDYINY